MKTKILLIDDDSNELLLYKDALTQIHGAAKCDYAKEVGDALSMVKKSRPDLVFINHHMQQGGSLQFLSVLKAEPSLRSARVYLVGEWISEDVSKMARTLGASGCIEKTNCENTFIRELTAILHPDLLPEYIFIRRHN
jgi:CheY-like chemotaxis protein